MWNNHFIICFDLAHILIQWICYFIKLFQTIESGQKEINPCRGRLRFKVPTWKDHVLPSSWIIVLNSKLKSMGFLCFYVIFCIEESMRRAEGSLPFQHKIQTHLTIHKSPWQDVTIVFLAKIMLRVPLLRFRAKVRRFFDFTFF